MITERERFAMVLGINMAIMEMMFSIGKASNQQPNRDYMSKRVFDLVCDICAEQDFKIGLKEFEEMVPVCYNLIIKSNDVCERVLGK